MPNESVHFVFSGVVEHGSLATSQAARTSFTPGKPTARADAENWPKDFLAANGTNMNDLFFERTMLTERRMVNDQVQGVPKTVSEEEFGPVAVDKMPQQEQRTGGDFLKARPS